VRAAPVGGDAREDCRIEDGDLAEVGAHDICGSDRNVCWRPWMDSCIRAAKPLITKGTKGHERNRGEGETTFAFAGVHVGFLFAVSGLGLSQTRGNRGGRRARAAAGGLRTGGRPAHHGDQFSTFGLYAWDLHLYTPRAWGIPPLHWKVEKGELPPGLKLEDDGTLHGARRSRGISRDGVGYR